MGTSGGLSGTRIPHRKGGRRTLLGMLGMLLGVDLEGARGGVDSDGLTVPHQRERRISNRGQRTRGRHLAQEERGAIPSTPVKVARVIPTRGGNQRAGGSLRGDAVGLGGGMDGGQNRNGSSVLSPAFSSSSGARVHGERSRIGSSALTPTALFAARNRSNSSFAVAGHAGHPSSNKSFRADPPPSISSAANESKPHQFSPPALAGPPPPAPLPPPAALLQSPLGAPLGGSGQQDPPPHPLQGAPSGRKKRSRPFVFISTFKWEMRKGWDNLLLAYLKVGFGLG